MLTVIIGKRSNLSRHLLGAIDDAVSVPASEAVEYLTQLDWQQHQSINLVLNQFQPATKLNNLCSPTDYVDNAIASTARILQSIQSQAEKINRIVYTSSSSVYGNNPDCKESDAPAPISLHATLKLANENLISFFCDLHMINYTIARVFNMYAGEDEFSIISKIIRAVKRQHTINLINQGGAVRDFIHIDDVAYAYQQLLLTKPADKIVNIASGQGMSVKMILDYLLKHNITVSTLNIEQDEIKTSIANNDRLLSLLGSHCFQSVKDYVFDELTT